MTDEKLFIPSSVEHRIIHSRGKGADIKLNTLI